MTPKSQVDKMIERLIKTSFYTIEEFTLGELDEVKTFDSQDDGNETNLELKEYVYKGFSIIWKKQKNLVEFKRGFKFYIQ